MRYILLRIAIAIKRNQVVKKIAYIISINTSERVGGMICGYHQDGIQVHSFPIRKNKGNNQ